MIVIKPDLINYRKNTYSQFGEDGILQQLFQELGIGVGLCLEVGAWDGIQFSNTRALIEKGWKAVLIEGADDKYEQLVSNYAYNPRVRTVHEWVGSDNRLCDALVYDSITKNCQEPDLAIIDIDGDDYYVFKEMGCTPKVVVVECNPSFSPWVEFIQKRDCGLRLGCSALALVKLGQDLGYKLVCFNAVNLIFVRTDLADTIIQGRRTDFCYLYSMGMTEWVNFSKDYDGRLYTYGTWEASKSLVFNMDTLMDKADRFVAYLGKSAKEWLEI